MLVNDWSARAIQRWEYQPLGPFLGKSFATSISPWVVPLDALEPFRIDGPQQDPPPLRYLRTDEPWSFDLPLEILLNDSVVSRTNARHLYWNAAQMLAHATVNGATDRGRRPVRVGHDLRPGAGDLRQLDRTELGRAGPDRDAEG